MHANQAARDEAARVGRIAGRREHMSTNIRSARSARDVSLEPGDIIIRHALGCGYIACVVGDAETPNEWHAFDPLGEFPGGDDAEALDELICALFESKLQTKHHGGLVVRVEPKGRDCDEDDT